MESIVFSRELLWLIVVLGVVARVRQYAANRSLWLDESFLALNIVGRSMHRLLAAPLDFNQTAPAGFLVVEKLATDVFGKGEYALRAFPLACGIASLLLYPRLARRGLTPAGTVIAVALFAFAGPLIYFSSELKPYAGDVAATIAISLMALELLDNRLSVRRAVAYGLLGFVLIQLTYAGILAAAGIGAALVAIFAARRQWDRSASLIALVGPWSVGAGVFLLSHVGIEHSYFTRGKGSFAPLPTSQADVRWYFHRLTYVASDANLYHVLSTPLVLVSILAAVLVVVGAVNLLRRDWRLCVVLVAPVIGTLAASITHRYPMLARTILFFVPLVFLLIGNGIVVLARRLPAAVGATTAAFVAAVLLVHVAFAGHYDAAKPFGRAEMKKSLAYVSEHWRAGDVLYVHYGSTYAFGYYSECACFRLPGNRKPRSLWPVRRAVVREPSLQFPPPLIAESSSVILGAHTKQAPGAYAQDASLIVRHSRAWVLVTFYPSVRAFDLIQHELLGLLDRRGRRLTALLRGGTHLYLYEFPLHP